MKNFTILRTTTLAYLLFLSTSFGTLAADELDQATAEELELERMADELANPVVRPPDLAEGLRNDENLVDFENAEQAVLEVNHMSGILLNIQSAISAINRDECTEQKLDTIAQTILQLNDELAVAHRSVMRYASQAGPSDRNQVENLLLGQFATDYQVAAKLLVDAIGGNLSNWTEDCGKRLNQQLGFFQEYNPLVCYENDSHMYNCSKLRTYKVEASELAGYSPLTANQIVTAIQTGAEYWNAEATGGTFQYRGTENRSYEHYYTASECQGMNKNWGSIIQDDYLWYEHSLHQGDCCYGLLQYCESFLIHFHSNDLYLIPPQNMLHERIQLSCGELELIVGGACRKGIFLKRQNCGHDEIPT